MQNQPANESFSEKLTLLIVDKALIGLLLLIIGFLATYLIEKAKSKFALHNEASKQRIAIVSEFIELQRVYEHKIIDLFRNANRILSGLDNTPEAESRYIDSINTSLETCINMHESLEEKLSAVDFWLPAKLIKTLKARQSNGAKMVTLIAQRRLEICHSLVKEFEVPIPFMSYI